MYAEVWFDFQNVYEDVDDEKERLRYESHSHM